MTAGQSIQPNAVSCDDPAQILLLFPREARSLVVGSGRRLAAVTQRDWLVARAQFRPTILRDCKSGCQNLGTLADAVRSTQLANCGKKTFQGRARKGRVLCLIVRNFEG